jgi:hypothetical protein
MENVMITGSCLCGGIKYEVEEIPGRIYNCHCSQCRKAHGAAFATQSLAIGKTLRILKGEELLKEYTGHGGVRAFCSNCGSRLMNYTPDKSLYLSVALSSIDSQHVLKPVAHAFVDSKAAWYEPPNDIPSYPGLPDDAPE